MRALFAFTKKELTEQSRSGRFVIQLTVFCFLGILNPATAKLTPWLFEMMAESLSQSGMTVTVSEVSSLDSWVQFFKNIPLALTVFILLQSNSFTKEYQSGTLVLSLTKGLKRYKVLISKTAVLFVLWSLFYWLCFGITYLYSEYYWDNSVVSSFGFSAFCWWLFGLWVVSLCVLFSTASSSNVFVLLGCGAGLCGSYLLGMLPKISKFLPTLLTDANSLIYGVSEAESYFEAMAVTALFILIDWVLAYFLFNKKRL